MKARYGPYPTHKPSGVEWLGQIPAHWEIKRLKYVAAVNPPAKSDAAAPLPEEVSYLPMEAVGEHGGLDLSRVIRPEAVSPGLTRFRDNDVVVAKITPCFENGKGALALGLAGGEALGTTELHVLRLTPEMGCKFMFYLTICHLFRGLGAAEMYGAGGQKRVPDSFVRDFVTPLPPISEQGAVAAFLDRETAKIDALVAKKERLIELLQEKRSALITHAVTRGLDPTVPTKGSGVQWLGEIPADWQV